MVLDFLGARVPFGLWTVTKTEGDNGVVLHSKGDGFDIASGTVFSWSDSFCSRMLQGLGPRVAPRVREIPAYCDVPMRTKYSIEAYVGVPIFRNDGAFFGTLSGFDGSCQRPEIVDELPTIELLAELLGSLVESERQIDGERRRAERAEAESMVDELTKLGNRRAWERTIEAEEARCARYGDPASVLVIDLDDLKNVNDRFGHEAGDQLLRLTGIAIQLAARDGDFTARIGGDEFAILAVHANAEDAELIRERVEAELGRREVRASVGIATRNPTGGLNRAIILADTRMYETKLGRRANRSG